MIYRCVGATSVAPTIFQACAVGMLIPGNRLRCSPDDQVRAQQTGARGYSQTRRRRPLKRRPPVALPRSPKIEHAWYEIRHRCRQPPKMARSGSAPKPGRTALVMTQQAKRQARRRSTDSAGGACQVAIDTARYLYTPENPHEPHR